MYWFSTQRRLSSSFQHSLRPLIHPRCSALSTGGCSLTALWDAAAYTSANLRSIAANPSSLQIIPSMLPASTLLQSNEEPCAIAALTHIDRKSTRLNSSHLGISYAVFCLKKKIT